jgi:hypothetical protein
MTKPLVFLPVLLLTFGFANAADVKKTTNQEVLKTWQQSNPQAPKPELVEKEDGSTQIKWTGSVTPDLYSNSVTSSNVSQNSSLQEGTFHKTLVNSDLKRIHTDGRTDYFLFTVLETDDPKVLSNTYVQLNNLQIGHVGKNFHVLFGDVIPQFSTLSSSLSARGLWLQSGFTELFNLTAYYGTVSESWESLLGQVTRTQYLRDVYGVKLDRNLFENVNAYLTFQSGEDRKSSLPAAFSADSKLSSYTAGAAYQKDQLQVSGEWGSSRSTLGTDPEETASGFIIDGRWVKDSVTLFGGHHDIGSRYYTLSSGAAPGVTESYVGTEWVAKEWLNLGADLRNTNSFSPGVSEATSKTKARTVKAASNLNSANWALNVQNALSETSVPGASDSSIDQSNVTLNYSATTWSAALGYGLGKFDYGAGSTNNSETKDVQVSLANKWIKAGEGNVSPWSCDSTLSYTTQRQSVVASNDVVNTMYSLGITTTHTDYGSLSAMASTGKLMQATAGQPDLVTNSLQIEAGRQFKNASDLKIYYQDNARNLNDPNLETKEKVVGARYAYKF